MESSVCVMFGCRLGGEWCGVVDSRGYTWVEVGDCEEEEEGDSCVDCIAAEGDHLGEDADGIGFMRS